MLRLLPPCQDRSRRTPVKAYDVLDPERLRLTSFPNLTAESDFLRINETLRRLPSGHPFADYSHPPVTVMGCRTLLRAVFASTEVLTDATKIPVANLCN